MLTAIKILHFNYLVAYRSRRVLLSFFFFFFFVFSVLSDKVFEVKVNTIKDTPGWLAQRFLFSFSLSTLVPALSVVPKQALPT